MIFSEAGGPVSHSMPTGAIRISSNGWHYILQPGWSEQYAALNSLAKQNGGYYSSFKGNGAVPGFLFKTAEERQKFVEVAGAGKSTVSYKQTSETKPTGLQVSAIEHIPGTHGEAVQSISDLPAHIQEQMQRDGVVAAKGVYDPLTDKVYLIADHIRLFGGLVDAEGKRTAWDTRVGKFIRKTSINELPQFWNVLLGDMSLVGTRPPTPDEVNNYKHWQHKRIFIKPGITVM